MDWSNPTFQAVGLLAAMFSIAASSQVKDRRLIVLSMIGSALLAWHYSMVGGWTAAAMAGVSASRYGVRLYFSGPILTIPFLLVMVVLGLSVWDHSMISLLPIVGSAASIITTTLWSGARLRVGMLFSAACWLAFNIHAASFGGVAINVVNGMLLIRAIWILRSEAAVS